VIARAHSSDRGVVSFDDEILAAKIPNPVARVGVLWMDDQRPAPADEVGILVTDTHPFTAVGTATLATND